MSNWGDPVSPCIAREQTTIFSAPVRLLVYHFAGDFARFPVPRVVGEESLTSFRREVASALSLIKWGLETLCITPQTARRFCCYHSCTFIVEHICDGDCSCKLNWTLCVVEAAAGFIVVQFISNDWVERISQLSFEKVRLGTGTGLLHSPSSVWLQVARDVEDCRTHLFDFAGKTRYWLKCAHVFRQDGIAPNMSKCNANVIQM